jgi:hypothetical protein
MAIARAHMHAPRSSRDRGGRAGAAAKRGRTPNACAHLTPAPPAHLCQHDARTIARQACMAAASTPVPPRCEGRDRRGQKGVGGWRR